MADQSSTAPESTTTPASAASAFQELLPETRRALTFRLARAQAEGRAPSLVGAVARDGHRLWWHAVSCDGRAPDRDLQYRIGSITKTFVAVLVLRLREEGRLELSDPVGSHLPDLPEAVAGRTLAQLLSHTSGLTAETPAPWWERSPGALRPGVADVLRDPPLLHPAGRRHHYSNPGYALLGAVVERLRGARWDEVLHTEVLDPLGLARTAAVPSEPHAQGWAVHPWADVLTREQVQRTGAMGPAGQLWSTAEDLSRFAGFLLAGHPGVLPRAAVAELRQPVSPVTEESWTTAWGLGVQLLRRGDRVLFGHGGSMPGFLATLWIDAAEGVSGATLSNVTSGPAVNALAADLVETVATREPRLPEPWRPVPAEEADPELLALTGPWYWGPSAYLLRLRAGRMLELAPAGGGGGRSSRFRPVDTAGRGDVWTGLDGYFAGEELRAVRGADGAVSHLDLGSFVFTREPYDPSAPIPGGTDPEGWRGL